MDPARLPAMAEMKATMTLFGPCSSTTVCAMSLRTTDSAHARSRLTDCHPGRSLHTSHFWQPWNAMPAPELVSVKASPHRHLGQDAGDDGLPFLLKQVKLHCL